MNGGDPPDHGGTGWNHEGVSGGGKPEFLPELLPQHTIFLSHSGEDKPFVRHLYAEFEKLQYYPFFDQKDHSLPIGERFPGLIETAARKCLVAVVVLSEAFVTSKWPMKELYTFVDAKKPKSRGSLIENHSFKGRNLYIPTEGNGAESRETHCENPTLKLVPVFYKLTPDVLREGLQRKFWKHLLWKELVKMHGAPNYGEDFTPWQYSDAADKLDGFITKEQYTQGLRSLLAVNGLRFERSGNDDVKYIKEVVKAVLQHVPRQLSVDVTGIKAYERLCKDIETKFRMKDARSYLGLYGKAGVGKSTICCEAMFQYVASQRHVNFRGYCRVRLEIDKAAEGKGAEEKKRQERIKSAIIQLVGMPKILSKVVTELEAREYLSTQLNRLQQPVFLVIDNVSDSSLDEAKWYANDLFLPSGSCVLFTSRSRDNLVSLLGENYCEPFPTLENEEAMEFFLSRARPSHKSFSTLDSTQSRRSGSLPELKPEELEILDTCLHRCRLEEQFIPRLLSKFAFFLHETKGDILSWGEYIGDADNILDLEYDKLDDVSKLIFLDLAIFADDMCFTHMDFHAELEWSEHSNYRLVIDFIAMLHDIHRHVAEKKVKELQNASLLKESKTEISVSDDYVDFAFSAIMRPSGVEKLCMLCSPEDEEDFVDGTLRVILSRVMFDHDLYNLREWGTVQFLFLVEVENLPILDLQGLRSLRVLRVTECDSLTKIVCRCNSSSTDGRFCYQKKRGCLSELRVVQLEFLENLKQASFPEHCRKLESLWFYECPGLDCLPDLRYCKKLKRLRLPCGDFNGFQGLGSNQALTELAFDWDRMTIRNFTKRMREKLFRDVMNLKNLKILDIVDESEEYDWIPVGISVNVENLTHLTFLDLSCASTVKEIEGLEELSQLTSLGLYGCCELRKLPDLLRSFKKLKRLCISHCHKLDLPEQDELWDGQVGAFHALGESCAFGQHECLDPLFIEASVHVEKHLQLPFSEEQLGLHCNLGGQFEPQYLEQPHYSGQQEGPHYLGGQEGLHHLGGQEGLHYPGRQEGLLYPEGPRYPGGQEGAHYLGGQEGAHYPGRQEGAHYPAGQEGAHYPAGQERAHYPTGQEGAHYPGRQEGLLYPEGPRCPGGQEGLHYPGGQGGLHYPGGQEGLHYPGGQEGAHYLGEPPYLKAPEDKEDKGFGSVFDGVGQHQDFAKFELTRPPYLGGQEGPHYPGGQEGPQYLGGQPESSYWEEKSALNSDLEHESQENSEQSSGEEPDIGICRYCDSREWEKFMAKDTQEPVVEQTFEESEPYPQEDTNFQTTGASTGYPLVWNQDEEVCSAMPAPLLYAIQENLVQSKNLFAQISDVIQKNQEILETLSNLAINTHKEAGKLNVEHRRSYLQ